MPFPFSLCQRHPRYALFLTGLLFLSFFLLSSSGPEYSLRSTRTSGLPPDPSLPGRVAQGEEIYKNMLEQRDDLVKKYGPTPAQVVMFPADQEPWPAYTVWDFFPPAYNCPHEVERIGALGDGGKWMCGLSRLAHKPDCVVYAFGLDWDSSFEAAVLQRTHFCEVWGFDWTTSGFGKQVYKVEREGRRGRAHFMKVGLGAEDSHGPGDEPKMWTLKSLMKENGHSHIDLLRIDIEGWEFDTLRALIGDFVPSASTGVYKPPSSLDDGAPDEDNADELPFGQLLIELHLWNKRFHDFLGWWEMLEAAGLRPFRSEANMVYANYNKQSGVELSEYSFLNVRGSNVFISDRPPPTRISDAAAAAAAAERGDDDLELDAATVAVGAKGVRYRPAPVEPTA